MNMPKLNPISRLSERNQMLVLSVAVGLVVGLAENLDQYYPAGTSLSFRRVPERNPIPRASGRRYASGHALLPVRDKG